jgi:hypothetical protein
MDADHELEAALARVMAPATPAEDPAAERVVARLQASPLPPQKRRWLAAWWPSVLMDGNFAPAWPRVTALACGTALGVVVGLSSLGTRIATDLDLWQMASADDVRTAIFDTDSVTGLRP